LPQQRKLPEDSMKKAVELLSVNANKQLVQAVITAETGKVVLLRDLTNIFCRTKNTSSCNSLDSFVASLQNKYGTLLSYSILIYVLCNLRTITPACNFAALL